MGSPLPPPILFPSLLLLPSLWFVGPVSAVLAVTHRVFPDPVCHIFVSDQPQLRYSLIRVSRLQLTCPLRIRLTTQSTTVATVIRMTSRHLTATFLHHPTPNSTTLRYTQTVSPKKLSRDHAFSVTLRVLTLPAVAPSLPLLQPPHSTGVTERPYMRSTRLERTATPLWATLPSHTKRIHMIQTLPPETSLLAGGVDISRRSVACMFLRASPNVR